MGTAIAIVVGSIAAIAIVIAILVLRSKGVTAPVGEAPTPGLTPLPPSASSM